MRPSISQTMLNVAFVLAQRATCRKLKVGCVIVDRYNKIIGTGYNGVPRHMPHCTDNACAGANAPKGSDLCEAVHAEQNALMQCQDINAIETVYTTHTPCMRCTKLLLNTSCRTIIYSDDANMEVAAERLWLAAGRDFVSYSTLETEVFI